MQNALQRPSSSSSSPSSRPRTSYRTNSNRRRFGRQTGNPRYPGNPRGYHNTYSDDQQYSFLSTPRHDGFSSHDVLLEIGLPTSSGHPLTSSSSTVRRATDPRRPQQQRRRLDERRPVQPKLKGQPRPPAAPPQPQRPPALAESRPTLARAAAAQALSPASPVPVRLSRPYKYQNENDWKERQMEEEDASPPASSSSSSANPMASPTDVIPKKKKRRTLPQDATAGDDDVSSRAAQGPADASHHNTSQKTKKQEVIDLVDDEDDETEKDEASPNLATPNQAPSKDHSPPTNSSELEDAPSSSATAQQEPPPSSSSESSSSQSSSSCPPSSTSPQRAATSLSIRSGSGPRTTVATKSPYFTTSSASSSLTNHLMKYGNQASSSSASSPLLQTRTTQREEEEEPRRSPAADPPAAYSSSDPLPPPRKQQQQDSSDQPQPPQEQDDDDNDQECTIVEPTTRSTTKPETAAARAKRIADQCDRQMFVPPSAATRDDPAASTTTTASTGFRLTKHTTPAPPHKRQRRGEPQRMVRATETASVTTTATTRSTSNKLMQLAGSVVANVFKKNSNPKKGSKITVGASLQQADPQRTASTNKSSRTIDRDANSGTNNKKTKNLNGGVEPIGLQPKLRRSPRGAAKQKKEPEIVELDDSDDEEEEDSKSAPPNDPLDEEEGPIKYEAARISIGPIVMHVDCKVVYHPHGDIGLEFRHEKRRTRNSTSRGEGEWTEIDIGMREHVQQFLYFSCGTAEDEESFDSFSFFALTTTGKLTQKLKTISANFDPSRECAERSFVVVEFREDGDLDRLVQDLNHGNRLEGQDGEPQAIPAGMAQEYCTVLLKDSRAEEADRIKSFQPTKPGSSGSRGSSKTLSSSSTSSSNGKGPSQVLLVYPFAGSDQAMEEAAQELHELKDGCKAPVAGAHGPKPSGRRDHFLSIELDDVQRLEPQEYLNDTLIDFWMRWISRADQSNTHFFTTHFYTTLSELGVSAVQNWTQRKGINVFDKKMVFFPINKNFHWSLAVAVNPGAILGQTNLDDDQPLSCILFFDSLRSHPKIAVAKKIRNWLNAEWKRIHNDNQRPFTESSMKVHSPKVPYQENGWDCGVFVCRYAYGLYKLRDRTFSFRTCQLDVPRHPFKRMITTHEHFIFGADDIDRIRTEMGTLIWNLSKVYQSHKKTAAQTTKEEKILSKSTTLSETTSTMEPVSDAVSKQPESPLDPIQPERMSEESLEEDKNVDVAVSGDGSAKENIGKRTPLESSHLCQEFTSKAQIAKNGNAMSRVVDVLGDHQDRSSDNKAVHADSDVGKDPDGVRLSPLPDRNMDEADPLKPKLDTPDLRGEESAPGTFGDSEPDSLARQIDEKLDMEVEINNQECAGTLNTTSTRPLTPSDGGKSPAYECFDVEESIPTDSIQSSQHLPIKDGTFEC